MTRVKRQTGTPRALILASSASMILLSAGFLPARASKTAKLPHVTLNWYYPVPEVPPDQALVQAAVDKITEAKLHVNLQLDPVPFGSYNTKLQTLVASGTTSADIIWTSSWLFLYDQNVFAGAFQPINTLLKQYGRAIIKDIPSFILNSTKIHGKFYGVPNMQVAATDPGFMIEKRFVQQSHFNVAKVRHNEAAILPLLKYVKAHDPGIVPLQNGSPLAAPSGFWYAEAYGYWPVGPAYVKMGTDKITQALEAQKQYLNMVRQWYLAGYENQNAGTATATTAGTAYSTGHFAAYPDFTEKPGGQIERQLSDGGYPVVYARIARRAYFSGPYTTTLNAISARSQHPRRAMMVLNLVNSNSQLFNLLAFGIKNRDYTLVGPDTIKIKKNGGYAIDVPWVFGDIFHGYLLQGQGRNLWKVTEEWNASAHVSPFAGFTFNPKSVTTEMANVAAVGARWSQPLFTGSINPAKYYPEYLSQLKAAGIGKILKALQSQVNAYVKANHINFRGKP